MNNTVAGRIHEWLTSHPDATSNAVADALQLTRSNVTAILYAMCRQGSVVREKGAVINPRGRALYTYRAGVLPTTPLRRFQSRRKSEAKPQLAVLEKPANHAALCLVQQLDETIETVAQKLADAFAAAIEIRLASALEGIKTYVGTRADAFDPVPTHDAIPPEQAQPRKPRIGAVGLLHTQEAEIRREFEDTYDIRFWTTDCALRALKPIAVGCEAVFVHTRHISHSVSEVLKSNGAKIVWCDGGISGMKDAIVSYYVGQIDSQAKPR
jgi:hypothetical protein